MNSAPLNGSWLSCRATRAAKPSNPRRISVAPATSQIFTPAGGAIHPPQCRQAYIAVAKRTRSGSLILAIAHTCQQKEADLPRQGEADRTLTVFAKLKSLIRTAAPRTREALWTGIGAILDRFSPAECRN
jgi:ribosomal protein L4